MRSWRRTLALQSLNITICDSSCDRALNAAQWTWTNKRNTDRRRLCLCLSVSVFASIAWEFGQRFHAVGVSDFVISHCICLPTRLLHTFILPQKSALRPRLGSD